MAIQELLADEDEDEFNVSCSMIKSIKSEEAKSLIVQCSTVSVIYSSHHSYFAQP